MADIERDYEATRLLMGYIDDSCGDVVAVPRYDGAFNIAVVIDGGYIDAHVAEMIMYHRESIQRAIREWRPRG